jgi:excisionase family DNA binding protein
MPRTESATPSPSSFTVAEFALAHRVCTATVYRLVAAGKLPARRLGRAIRIPADASPVDKAAE